MSNYDSTTGGESGVGGAKKILGEAGQTLKSEVQSFASVAGERMWAQADKAAQVATKTIGDLAQAVRRAGEELGSSDQNSGSRLAGKAASGLEDLSGALANKRPEELIETVRGFGRRNPALFVGGAVVLGIALGRFLRSADAGRPGASDFRDFEMDLEADDSQPAPASGAMSFARSLDTDPATRPFAADPTPTSVLSVDDGGTDPNADPYVTRPGT